MKIDELLEAAESLAPRKEVRWSKYRKVFFELVDQKNYQKIEAVRWISKKVGLSEIDTDRLYQASRQWKNERGHS